MKDIEKEIAEFDYHSIEYTDDQKRLMVGILYNKLKKIPRFGIPRRKGGSAAFLAEKYNIGRSSVERAGKFAEKIRGDSELRKEIENGSSVKDVTQKRLYEKRRIVDEKVKRDLALKGKTKMQPLAVAHFHVERAIHHLERIESDDLMYKEAFKMLKEWVEKNEK